MDALRTAEGEAQRRAAKVAPATFLAVARADWAAADIATGRGVATAHETVGQQLGMSGKTVQRSRDLMVALGFAVTVAEGRYLTRAERAAARELHGQPQKRAASLRALTLPRPPRNPQAVENVQLPRRGSVLFTSYLSENSSTHAQARDRAASRQLTTKRVQSARRPAMVRAARPIEHQRFAAALVRRLPWLARDRHIGSVVRMIDSTKIDVRRWSADALVDAINAHISSRGARPAEPGSQRNPVGYLAALIRTAIDPDAETPLERQRRTAAERADRMARQAEQQRADAERAAQIDHAEVARIIEQMKRDQAARDRATAERERLRKAELRRRIETDRATSIEVAYLHSRSVESIATDSVR